MFIIDYPEVTSGQIDFRLHLVSEKLAIKVACNVFLAGFSKQKCRTVLSGVC